MGSDKKTATAALDAIASVVTKEVVAGGAVTLPGLGKIVCRTRPDGPRDPTPDGPLAELTGLLDELKRDDDALRALWDRELSDLRKKLGPDLLDGLDPRSLVDDVGTFLLTRLGACRGE